jgi:hypothetical protein
MPNADVLESDPFFTLLTDALRAGPGSPEWHQAVAKLREEGVNGRDEYKLLTEARAHLESGRGYRAVRAGPDFTRRLLTRIGEEPAPRGGPQTATVVMILSAVAILAALGAVAYVLKRGVNPADRPVESGPNLATMYFPADLATATFDGRVPAGWDTIGRLPLHTDGTLRPAVVPMAQGDYIGGGVVAAQPVPAGEPFALEAVVTVPETGGDFIAEVFVSDSADFSEFRATAPTELVWLLQGADQKVMVKGQGQGRVEKVRQFDKPVTVRIVVDKDRALVESRTGEGADAQASTATVLWSGPHGLAPDKPKYAGVRFIRGAGESPDVAAVKSIRVLGKGNSTPGANNGPRASNEGAQSPREQSVGSAALRRGVALRSRGNLSLASATALPLTLTLSPEYKGEGTRGGA